MPTTTTHQLPVPGAVLTYDVHTPDAPGPHRPVMVFGSPMSASGFEQLVPLLDDRTVVTYDPRMAERSKLDEDGEVSFEIHGDDVHRVVEATGLGPVDVFASSGGAVAALPWLLAHPEQVGTVVLHEPPLSAILEDREVLERAYADIVATYRAHGQGPAMAKFIQLVMVQGPLPDDYLDRPAPSPEQFGLPAEDDGSRDDALLGHNMAIPAYQPDVEALRASGVRIVPAVGAASTTEMPRRAGEALAALLGVEVVEFPGDHGGFVANEWSPGNDPAAFAARLKDVLDQR
ncbi:alpha/beta hydrolase [Nocardioides aromaticivorans]|uniref:Alpha/beta hydrolase n=1 Tax=Nocardioides aromaticivorans TaxID=200618 RepID=A0ABX7PT18_9ACTN|nr:alpha/beta hydrolase [Nocardioides aromaticivorans]QSR28847.1 alpha/beta hydrolase [Nocardioides aromaticivorans]